MREALSVVMAAPFGSAAPQEARQAFLAQLDSAAGDELLVEEGERGVLVPSLWARGIARSRGRIVALTLGSMTPDPGWEKALRETLTGDVAGVGGAIEPEPAMRSLDWAIHLCRYSSYLLPFEARDVKDLPGDNAAYRREAIEPLREIWKSGFWETEVDAALLTNRRRLRVTPRMVVRQGGSAGFQAFCRNRFLHGIESGRHRARLFSLPGRLLRALFFPAAAAILLLRIRRRSGERGRAAGFRRGLPLLAVFLLVWSAGEAIGYLEGGR